MKFSEWFRSQSHRNDGVGHTAKEWNKRDPKSRRGRVNAVRLNRELGTPMDVANTIMEEFQVHKSSQPLPVAIP